MSNPKTTSSSIYHVHPAIARLKIWEESLSAKTGKTLEEWISIVKQAEFSTAKGSRDWLKLQFQLGTNRAWLIGERIEGKGWADSDPIAYLITAQEYVDAMFSGAKFSLYPLYEILLTLGKQLGCDVKVCPCKTIIPFYRKHVFAQIKPCTRTRIDLGLALGECQVSDRLINTGGFAKGDRITHRISITTVADIDDEVKYWLKTAYNLDN
ncbi:DUF4287 domain-containing protein [soil metagenome]